MDLNRIAVFVRVVEEKGFTAAARVLGLPKSSVSRSVALLEEALGARLLHRSTRSVRLTEAGAAWSKKSMPTSRAAPYRARTSSSDSSWMRMRPSTMFETGRSMPGSERVFTAPKSARRSRSAA